MAYFLDWGPVLPSHGLSIQWNLLTRNEKYKFRKILFIFLTCKSEAPKQIQWQPTDNSANIIHPLNISAILPVSQYYNYYSFPTYSFKVIYFNKVPANKYIFK